MVTKHRENILLLLFASYIERDLSAQKHVLMSHTPKHIKVNDRCDKERAKTQTRSDYTWSEDFLSDNSTNQLYLPACLLLSHTQLKLYRKLFRNLSSITISSSHH